MWQSKHKSKIPRSRHNKNEYKSHAKKEYLSLCLSQNSEILPKTWKGMTCGLLGKLDSHSSNKINYNVQENELLKN